MSVDLPNPQEVNTEKAKILRWLFITFLVGLVGVSATPNNKTSPESQTQSQPSTTPKCKVDPNLDDMQEIRNKLRNLLGDISTDPILHPAMLTYFDGLQHRRQAQDKILIDYKTDITTNFQNTSKERKLQFKRELLSAFLAVNFGDRYLYTTPLPPALSWLHNQVIQNHVSHRPNLAKLKPQQIGYILEPTFLEYNLPAILISRFESHPYLAYDLSTPDQVDISADDLALALSQVAYAQSSPTYTYAVFQQENKFIVMPEPGIDPPGWTRIGYNQIPLD
jgi:hypothetical protein